MSTETFTFQAEINQLLSLIINTFYSNKDIFLRELVSNASDALDKLRYMSLTNKDILNADPSMEIRIIPNIEDKTITIEDTGIGMSKEDLIGNLGTIAKSGTKSFIETLMQNTDRQHDMSLIGQFGVGFYSAYLVAEKVTVYTRTYQQSGFKWESTANGTFTITESDETPLRGTRIILHLKTDQCEYLEEHRLRTLVHKHNEFIGFPIKLLVSKEVEVENIEPEEDGTVHEDKAKETTKAIEKIFEVLNSQTPIWVKSPDDVAKEEYSKLYKSISNDWDDPLHTKHFKVEGGADFKSVLFIPKRAPFDMYNQSTRKQTNIKLYVKRVFIMDNSEELIPEYMSFIKGIVDSDDLPLNVSREMLQQNRIVSIIKKNITKKSIEMIDELASNPERKGDFDQFYENYSKNIKLGVHEDEKNRDKLAKFLRFYSSKSLDVMTSLDDYLMRMTEGQSHIYFIAGENKASLINSPFIEALKNRNHEVLFMTDAIDEYMMQQLREYKDKKFVNCAKEGNLLEETDDEKQERVKIETEYENVCKEFKKILDNKVTKVVISKRVTSSPCVIVTDTYGWTANMERIVKAQALRDGSYSMPIMRTLEINAKHPIIKEIKKRTESSITSSTKDLMTLLYESALLNSGFSLENPTSFVNRINNMIAVGLSIEDDRIETLDSDQTTSNEECHLEELD